MARIRRFSKCLLQCGIVLIIVFTSAYYLVMHLLEEQPIPFSTVTNYFLETGTGAQNGYIIDTPTCNILNFSAWEPAILPFVTAKSRKVDCGAREPRQWTYTRGTNVIINATALERSGYSFNTVECCYMTITRQEQTLQNYDFYADRIVTFSKDCTKLPNLVNPVQAEFIRVLCAAKSWPFSYDILYRQFHSLPQPSKNEVVKNQIDFWKGIDASEIPPNIVIIGIDSVSRLGFHRNMNSTKKVLEGMGAVEMLGYTKVGENTFPNALPLLTGYFQKEIVQMCFYNSSTPQDACPFLFKRFTAANYLTAMVDDVPGLSAFHYQKVGFVKPPVDFYYRPFMLAVHQHTPNPWWTLDCIGYRTVDQVLLQYINDLMILSNEKNTPLFLFSWMTNLAHEDINSAQHGDGYYAEFLKKADLENTVLFFMSDHGYRYGSIRQTFPGWYEEKLPTLWIRLPESIKQKYPHWQKALEVNSKRLTSPFDLFATMNHILDVFTVARELPTGKTLDKKEILRKYGQTVFHEVPLERQCKDAGISENFCACAVPNKLPLNDPIVIRAAAAAVGHINGFLPKQCAQLTLDKIAAAAVMKSSGTTSMYVIAFVTIPGDFVFEANVNFDSEGSKFSIDNSNFLRMSKMTTDISCIHDDFVERFCYCGTAN